MARKDISKIEAILLEDPHIVGIQPAEEWNLHEMDYSKLCDKAKDYLKEIVGELHKFLSSPYIVDNFANHAQRREWRGELVQRHDEETINYYWSTCLRWNHLSSFWGGIIDILEEGYIGSETSRLKELGDRVRQLQVPRVEYDSKSNPQKIDYVREIKRAVYNFLEFFAVNPQHG